MKNTDFAFLHCDEYPHCTALVDKHFDGYWTLQLMEAGAVEVIYDEERHDLRDGVWFWPAFPGPHIRFHLARDCHEWHHRYAAFIGTRVSTWKAAGLWPQKPQKSPRPAQNLAQFDELLHLIRRGDPWATRRAIHTLEGILLELAEAREKTEPDEEWLRTTRQFLGETQDFVPDYAQLAHKLGWGLSTLRRKFREATGSSLHEALLQNRLDAARRALGETDLPLKEVAARLGYRNVHFFSSQFKALSGVTPATYRRSRQTSEGNLTG